MSKKKAMISGMIALTMVLASGTGAYATDDTEAVQKCDMAKITQEQITAIRDARTNSITTAVENLVSDGIITQEEADNILEKFDNQPTENSTGQKGMGRFSNLTDNQREALNTERETLYEEALTELVSEAIITQDQTVKLLEDGHDKDLNLTEEQITAIRDARTNSMTIAVENLVSDGTITQEDADSILTIPEKPAKDKSTDEEDTDLGDNQTPTDKIKTNGMFKDLTEEQSEALHTEIETLYKSELAKLVSVGTITEDISEQIQEIPSDMCHGMNHSVMNGVKSGNGHGMKGGVSTQNRTELETN